MPRKVNQQTLNLYLTGSRGLCAGVERAINMVEEALKKYGKPVYVRHEIVHNKYVVEKLRSKGVIFIDELELHLSMSKIKSLCKIIYRKVNYEGVTLIATTQNKDFFHSLSSIKY